MIKILGKIALVLVGYIVTWFGVSFMQTARFIIMGRVRDIFALPPADSVPRMKEATWRMTILWPIWFPLGEIGRWISGLGGIISRAAGTFEEV